MAGHYHCTVVKIPKNYKNLKYEIRAGLKYCLVMTKLLRGQQTKGARRCLFLIVITARYWENKDFFFKFISYKCDKMRKNLRPVKEANCITLFQGRWSGYQELVVMKPHLFHCSCRRCMSFSQGHLPTSIPTISPFFAFFSSIFVVYNIWTFKESEDFSLGRLVFIFKIPKIAQ